ncbi:hypothetical protein PIB30_046256 [Stylosanthes scabra]|uniref:F-box domain-containing protein n=1 Tax=Stylosanthes scabra TaxID=79078 RepID=A0ABU6WGR0_9FABA|nr:hypothetical protein [Stylosanthes scabra]
MAVNLDVNVLPQEVWVHIATMVAKESFPNLLSMKQSCKFFRSIAEFDEVLDPEQPASCRSTTCPTRGLMPETYRKHQLNHQLQGGADVSCDYCRADYEILVFFEMLSHEED